MHGPANGVGLLYVAGVLVTVYRWLTTHPWARRVNDQWRIFEHADTQNRIESQGEAPDTSDPQRETHGPQHEAAG